MEVEGLWYSPIFERILDAIEAGYADKDIKETLAAMVDSQRDYYCQKDKS